MVEFDLLLTVHNSNKYVKHKNFVYLVVTLQRSKLSFIFSVESKLCSLSTVVIKQTVCFFSNFTIENIDDDDKIENVKNFPINICLLLPLPMFIYSVFIALFLVFTASVHNLLIQLT